MGLKIKIYLNGIYSDSFSMLNGIKEGLLQPYNVLHLY
jgi:hypothetical protein